MRNIKIIIGFIFILGLASCHKDREEMIIDIGVDYFPLHQGQWIDYQVDSVKIFGLVSDTVHWEIKELVGSKLTDGSYIIYRYKRQSDTNEWFAQPVIWTAFASASEAQKVEENTRYVKLVFPVKEGRKWDGNSYNSKESQEYTMLDVNKDLEIKGRYFPNTLKVIQFDLTTLISQDYIEEIYAKDIGMVCARKIHIENLQSLQHKNGYIVDYNIKNWGKE